MFTSYPRLDVLNFLAVNKICSQKTEHMLFRPGSVSSLTDVPRPWYARAHALAEVRCALCCTAQSPCVASVFRTCPSAIALLDWWSCLDCFAVPCSAGHTARKRRKARPVSCGQCTGRAYACLCCFPCSTGSAQDLRAICVFVACIVAKFF